MAQLPSGAVRVRFAQLRQAAAPGTFPEDPNLDEALVELPLNRILPALNRSMLARRDGQVVTEVPSDVTGLFDSKSKTTAKVVSTGSNSTTFFTAAPAAPSAPPVPTFSPQAATVPSAPSPSAVFNPQPVSPAIAPVQAAPAPARVPIVQATPTGAVLTLKLAAIFEFWPHAVRQEITQLNLNSASVVLPMDRLETTLKTGRITFTWGELLQWLDGAPPCSSSLGDAMLELPLRVVAPLFLANRSATAPKQKVVVSDSVPNLFSRPGQKPLQPAPATTDSTGGNAGSSNVLGEVFGQPTKKEWTPQEVILQINALPGVLASAIAMSDGFLVTGEFPEPLKAERMAAFLPQMFGRMSHYAGEIQLTQPSALTLFTGQSQCAIYKAGTVFLAVLSKPNEVLPEAKLLRVAGELTNRI